MVETWQELGELSHKLNEKSNNLNALITSINERLEELNLGVEMWLDRPAEPTDPWLGYSYVEGQWQLALKAAGGLEAETIPAHWYGTPDSSIPLLKASRGARIKSMSMLPHLLVALKSKASELIASIDVAEKTAARM